MPENITGGILSAQTESMTFSAFGVKVRSVGALSNCMNLKKRLFHSSMHGRFQFLCHKSSNIHHCNYIQEI